MPSGKIDLPIVEDNRDGTIRVQYDPREAGVHELVLTHDGVPVPGMSMSMNRKLSFKSISSIRNRVAVQISR